jgi:hypothetical protein
MTKVSACALVTPVSRSSTVTPTERAMPAVSMPAASSTSIMLRGRGAVGSIFTESGSLSK